MLNVLLSAMHLEDENYIDTLSICSDTVVINQCDKESERTVEHTCTDGSRHKVRYVETTERGLSNSRNMAISNAFSDVCILCDNDVEYLPGYEEKILAAFDEHKDADVIVFFIKRPERQAPVMDEVKKMNYFSVLKIFSPEIAFRKSSVKDIAFDPLFGAGAKYPMGEENIFLYDCLRKGKKIMYVPIQIATLREEESTWFKGYDKDFFIARGANYAAMSVWFSHVLIWQFALRKKSLYGMNLTMKEALQTMYKGRKEYLSERKA